MLKIPALLSVLYGGTTALAAPSEFLTTGTGSYYDPYRLSRVQHLCELADEVRQGNSFEGKYLVLESDITFDGSEDFTGIGTAGEDTYNSRSFCGDFNGMLYTVSSLRLNTDGVSATGLFNSLGTGAYVHHLRLDSSCSVNGSRNTGGIAGIVWDGIIEFCSSQATISGTMHVGGIVGTLHAGAIQHCVSAGNVSATKSVGGIAGTLDGTSYVNGCYNTSPVRAASPGACGGIVGEAYGRAVVAACYNIGRVTGRRSEEFDITPAAIISDCPGPVWTGEEKGCCYVESYSGVTDRAARQFTAEQMRSATSADYLNRTLYSTDLLVSPSPAAIYGDMEFTLHPTLNSGFPIMKWEIKPGGSAVTETFSDKRVSTFVIEGNRLIATGDDSVSIFTPDGRFVAESADIYLAPGIYIANGQKIVITR